MKKISTLLVIGIFGGIALMLSVVFFSQEKHEANSIISLPAEQSVVKAPAVAIQEDELEGVWQRTDGGVVIAFKDGKIFRYVDGTCGPETRVFDSDIDPNAVVAENGMLIWHTNQICGDGTTIDKFSSGTFKRT